MGRNKHKCINSPAIAGAAAGWPWVYPALYHHTAASHKTFSKVHFIQVHDVQVGKTCLRHHTCCPSSEPAEPSRPVAGAQGWIASA